MPSLGGATEWLNTEPLGPAELRGGVGSCLCAEGDVRPRNVTTRERWSLSRHGESADS